MATPCAYCRRPLESDPPKWAGTAYHGQCRLDHLRQEWATATPERRDLIQAEADHITAAMRAA